MQDEFAHSPQDEEHKDSADAVHQEKPGPGAGQPSAGPEEQPGSDGTADRDHLQLPRFEALVVAGVLTVQRSRLAGGFGQRGHDWPPLGSSPVSVCGGVGMSRKVKMKPNTATAAAIA